MKWQTQYIYNKFKYSPNRWLYIKTYGWKNDKYILSHQKLFVLRIIDYQSLKCPKD